jgi:hypothetical protein
VDLHVGVHHLDDRPFRELERRSEERALEGDTIRVLGPEDHLRVLALHALGHDAWRPVWLVDIAVAVEARREGFDWEWFQSGRPRRTSWAAAAIRLAHAVLGASLEGVPTSIADAAVPRWAADAILGTWGRLAPAAPHGARMPMRDVRGGRALLSALWLRWPGPLEATLGVGAPIDSFPRWPIQLAECVARTARFVRGPRGGDAAEVTATELTASASDS